MSYKTLQLIESGEHDPKLSTLSRLVASLGYSPGVVERRLAEVFRCPIDSIASISDRIVEEGEDSWVLWVFNFVDRFLKTGDSRLVEDPPVANLSPRLKALLASIVETLCIQKGMPPPSWCLAIPGLDRPWFVSGVENLKASALVESPVNFRTRNIFVLGNFLSRA